MREGEDKMTARDIFSGVIDTLKDTYGSVVGVVQVEAWLREQGFESRDVKTRFPDEPTTEFFKEDVPLVFRVKPTRCLEGKDFAILIANSTKDYSPSFRGYVPLS